MLTTMYILTLLRAISLLLLASSSTAFYDLHCTCKNDDEALDSATNACCSGVTGVLLLDYFIESAEVGIFKIQEKEF